MKRQETFLVSFVLDNNEERDIAVVGKPEGGEYPTIVNAFKGKGVKDIYDILTRVKEVKTNVETVEEVSEA